jgi:hypothetical protein
MPPRFILPRHIEGSSMTQPCSLFLIAAAAVSTTGCSMAGVTMTHVPYKGVADAYPAVVSKIGLES